MNYLFTICRKYAKIISMKIIGIYKITCLPTGKFYIGSSKNVKKRISRHKDELRRKIHPNRYLQSAWNKYSETNFIFEIVQETSVELLIKTEQKWLDDTKSYNRTIGFNLSAKAESSEGIKFSLKSRNKKAKKWIVTDPSGKSFRITNLSRFCQKMNLNHSIMVMVAKGKRPHHKKWICRYPDEPYEEWYQKILNLKKPNGNNKKWIVTNTDGEDIIVDNLTEFCKSNNLNYGNMAHTANGFQINHKGWKCRTVGTDPDELLNKLKINLAKKKIVDRAYHQSNKLINICL